MIQPFYQDLQCSIIKRLSEPDPIVDDEETVGFFFFKTSAEAVTISVSLISGLDLRFLDDIFDALCCDKISLCFSTASSNTTQLSRADEKIITVQRTIRRGRADLGIQIYFQKKI